MDSIYLGSDFGLTLVGGIDLKGGTAVMEYGRRSETQRGIFSSTPAVVLDQATCTCLKDFTPQEINSTGLWQIWLDVITGEGKAYSGKPYLLRVKEKGR